MHRRTALEYWSSVQVNGWCFSCSVIWSTSRQQLLQKRYVCVCVYMYIILSCVQSHDQHQGSNCCKRGMRVCVCVCVWSFLMFSHMINFCCKRVIRVCVCEWVYDPFSCSFAWSKSKQQLPQKTYTSVWERKTEREREGESCPRVQSYDNRLSFYFWRNNFSRICLTCNITVFPRICLICNIFEDKLLCCI